ncbi:hypothetical protein [Mucilaginibacter phyllosphaerae]
MKGLKLKALNLGVKELLNREQMKNIIGGLASSSGSRGKCCATKNGDGYGGGSVPACSACVDNAVSCTLGVLVAC